MTTGGRTSAPRIALTRDSRATPVAGQSPHRLTPQRPVRPSVLCIDDDLMALDGTSRALSSRFHVIKVTNGADAVAAIQYGGPFTVALADYFSEESDGPGLLAQLRELSPNTVRVLVTQHDVAEEALAATSDGRIAAYVRKPYRAEVLLQRVTEAANHHYFLTSERERREALFSGSVKALTDLLALACPVGAGRAMRLRRYACDLAAALHVDAADVEIAATLSQIGCMTLAPALVQRIDRGAPLTSDERAIADRLPLVAEEIIRALPGLDGVREILRHLHDPFEFRPRGAPPDEVPFGSRVLRVASDFDTLYSQGTDIDGVVERMQSAQGLYDPQVLEALASSTSFFGRDLDTVEIPLSDVTLGMVFVRELLSPAGMLLVARGQDVTPSMLERVKTHWSAFATRERVRVVRHMPTGRG